MASHKVKDMGKAFELKLQALYDIEKQIEKALPKMAKVASSEALKEGFRMHLEETKEQSKRLEKAFELLGVSPKKLRSEGIRGIIVDGEWVMEVEGPDEIRDSMLASAARYVEHYEMAGYLSACAHAKALGLSKIEALLTESLGEEEATDKKLEKAMKDLEKEFEQDNQ